MSNLNTNCINLQSINTLFCLDCFFFIKHISSKTVKLHCWEKILIFTLEKEFLEKSQNIWENSSHNSAEDSVLISEVHQVVPEITGLQDV